MTRDKSATVKKTGSIRLRTVLLAVLGIVAVAAFIVLSMEPPALTDDQALAMLPEGAVILERHEQSRGRVQAIEYSYTREYAYCLVERTERMTFRYEQDVWNRDGEPEVLAETEDWSGLAGCWTERTEGPEARFLRVRVDGFDGGTLTGQVLYTDGAGACEGTAEELFSQGERVEDAGPWLLRGTGFFRYNYLRIDRDGGVYFDNDVLPMAQSRLPVEPPAPEDPQADERLLESVLGGGRTWLAVTADVNVCLTPAPDGETLGTAAAGSVLVCAGPLSEEGWYPVSYAGGTGYVPGGSVLELTEDMGLSVVTSLAELNVRAGPGTDYDWLGMVTVGARLVCTGLEGDWYRVIYNGQTAYVSGEYVTAEPLTVPEG